MFRNLCYFIVAVMLFVSCEQQKNVETFDDSAYQVSAVPSSQVKSVSLVDETGVLVEKGYTLNGLKTGNWTNFWQDGKKVKSIKHFIKGKLNGTFMKFNDRNQILELTNYLNDELHGYHVVYSWARPIKEITYNHGKINGEMKVYFNKHGKIQKVINFKNGVQDGSFQQFDFEGNLVLDYIYKDGKKISGGPVVKKEETD